MDPTGKGDQPVDAPPTAKNGSDTYDDKGDRIPPTEPWKTSR
ncbi:hypothetical protein AB0N05_37060 [Nocardia sp. NPDC051030]